MISSRNTRLLKLEAKQSPNIFYVIVPPLLADGKPPVIVQQLGRDHRRISLKEFEALKIQGQIIRPENVTEITIEFV